MTAIGMTYPLRRNGLKMESLKSRCFKKNFKRANKIKHKINSKNKEKAMKKC